MQTVLHVLQPDVGGVPAVVVQFATHHAQTGRRVVVAGPEAPYAERVRAAGAEHVPWQATRQPGPSVAAETRALARIVAAVQPDVVHLHSAKAGLAGRLAIRGRLPTVFQPHMWSFQAVDGVVHAGAVAWERFATRWTDLLVCVSEGERELGAAKRVRGKTAVLPNGVDVVRFAPRDAGAARAQLGLDDAPLAVCVGRITREKGQDLLLAAWPAVRARVAGAQLVVVGSGPDETLLRDLAVAGVTFVGDRDDVPAWLSAADVVVVPSRWEGMSLVMLEAMSSARPVVSTDVPGARDALGGGGGAIVPIDASALADAIAVRLGDRGLARAEGLQARATAERAHDLERVLARLDSLYADVLSSRSASAP